MGTPVAACDGRPVITLLSDLSLEAGSNIDVAVWWCNRGAAQIVQRLNFCEGMRLDHGIVCLPLLPPPPPTGPSGC